MARTHRAATQSYINAHQSASADSFDGCDSRPVLKGISSYINAGVAFTSAIKSSVKAMALCLCDRHSLCT